MPYEALNPASGVAAPTTAIGSPLFENGMTLEDYITELRPLLQGRVDIEEERYPVYVNLAYVDLVTSLKIPEAQGSLAITLVSGSNIYLLPDVVQALTYVSLQDPDLTDERDKGRPLAKIDLFLYRGRNHHTGRPKEFFRLNNMLVLWPTPGEDEAGQLVTIDFRIRPRDLENPNHCMILPSEWSEPLLWSARHKLLEALQEWEAAASAENAYVKSVRKRLDTEALEDDTRIVRSSVPTRASRLRKTRKRYYGMDE